MTESERLASAKAVVAAFPDLDTTWLRDWIAKTEETAVQASAPRKCQVCGGCYCTARAAIATGSTEPWAPEWKTGADVAVRPWRPRYEVSWWRKLLWPLARVVIGQDDELIGRITAWGSDSDVSVNFYQHPVDGK